jgi:hypothetical protein
MTSTAPAPPAAGWRLRLQRWRLRCWGWLICTASGDPHYVAELIRRGEWAALDRLLADLEADDHGTA